jgi:hypothetical protein
VLERDDRPRNILPIYHVRIECDLTTDVFSVTEDTGNNSLTLAIVMSIIARMENKRGT